MSGSRIERKLTAIFYADVAGYSRLTGVDEEGTHRRLSAHLDRISAAIESSGGRVVHYAGDAVLADFPSVVDAVSCATTIQQDLRERNQATPTDRRVEFRIGINLGDVMVDRNDIYGDGVNVAARLEGLADVGGICVSEAVYSQVRNRLDVGFELLGEKNVKNIAEPVTAYRLLIDGKPVEPAEKAEETPRTGRWQAFRARKPLVLLATALAFGFAVAVASVLFAPTQVDDASPSVAVFPFRVIGGGAASENFSQGLTADLVNELSKIPELKVVTSPSPDLADKLNAASSVSTRYRVVGSVQVADEKVRITTQLEGTESGFNLWGGRYDRSFTDTLQVQAEVAAKIVVALQGQLSAAEKDRVATETSIGGYLVAGLEQLGRFGEWSYSSSMNLFDRVTGGSE
ncbi:MAG: adenylate/guanylate cyclase domain-containing protein [Rhodospirillales bacterium]|nr:adenylate/guanylate cyclase domain-containing protein [Rhodospirillales bacterium]